MNTSLFKKTTWTIACFVLAVACNRDKEIIEYERLKLKAWDTTLASTLGRSDEETQDKDPVYLDTNWDERLNVEGGKTINFDINGNGKVDKGELKAAR